ncbi:hypothetical protein [Rhodococcus sp. ARC_M6]|uniref:hypothetical protein n=1 Tax=Rhodococcus sp. ARC_M6 TaxID=2928852 RepID=UPI001FB244C4|nr:hypothetical protein [Rhodococcus sp. ARC_M6]MCJ0906510.1 hypothetical protein [Rhodococcus sp. ARC_M6]
MSAVKFECYSGAIFPFVPVYCRNEFSFDVQNIEIARSLGYSIDGTSSIQISFLQISVDVKTGRALHVWGYHPNLDWKEGPALPSKMKSGEIRVNSEPPLEPGISPRFIDHEAIETIFDARSGWVRVTRNNDQEDDEIWEFCTGTAFGSREDKLHSIWIRPKFTD